MYDTNSDPQGPSPPHPSNSSFANPGFSSSSSYGISTTSSRSQVVPNVQSTHLDSSHTSEGMTVEGSTLDMARELEHHSWDCTVTSFIKFFFPNFEVDHSNRVQSRLPLKKITEFRLTYQQQSHKGDVDQEKLEERLNWPEGGKECRYYSPLCSLLEEIRLTYEAVMEIETCFRFLVPSRKMDSCLRKETALKPDILGLDGTLKNEENALWDQPVVAMVVKGNWKILLAQGGIHARSMLYGRPSRHVAWVILFNHRTNELRLCAYHRGGVTSTGPMVISTKEGYRDMVRVIVAFLNTDGLKRTGEDGTRDARRVILPDGRPGEIKEIIFQRPEVRGRATYVAMIEIIDADATNVSSATMVQNQVCLQPQIPSACLAASKFSPPEPMHPQITSASSSQGHDDPGLGYSSTRLEGEYKRNGHSLTVGPTKQFSGNSKFGEDASHFRRHLESISNAKMEVAQASLKGFTAGQQLFVLKESWSLEEKADAEYRMFVSVKGQCGLPEIITRWIVPSPYPNGFYPEDVTPWIPLPSQKPERRVLQRILFSTKGSPLTSATSPKQLLQAILHALIGHWNLFQAGFLHRDVSFGNILLLKQPIERPGVSSLHEQLAEPIECRGILIDGDMSLSLEAASTMDAGGAGTLPFMSLRLLNAWQMGRNQRQYFIDDLESFAWVLLWSSLEIQSTKLKADLDDGLASRWRHDLHALTIQTCVQFKKSIWYEVSSALRGVMPIPDEVLGVFRKWFKLCYNLQVTDGELDRMEAEERKRPNIYQQMVDVALKALPKAPDAW